MTLIGMWVEQDRAFVWADTEFYWRLDEDEDDKRHLCGRPLGHHLKIAVNDRANVAAVGAGDARGNELIGKSVALCDSFDHLCEGLPIALQRWAQFRYEALEKWPLWTAAAAGWSRRFRRMMGAVFDYPDFSNAFTSAFSRPALSELDGLHPSEPADILGFARAQMRRLKKTTFPLGGAGAVTIAHVERSGISATSFDLVTGHAMAGLPDLPPMEALAKSPNLVDGPLQEASASYGPRVMTRPVSVGEVAACSDMLQAAALG